MPHFPKDAMCAGPEGKSLNWLAPARTANWEGGAQALNQLFSPADPASAPSFTKPRSTAAITSRITR